MKCLRNPITLEIRRVTETEGRSLARYGWVYVTKGEWKRSLRPDYPAMRAKANEIVQGMKMRRPA